MASSELIIRDYNLETEFLGSCVRHTTYHPNTTQGERLVKAVKTWSRGRKLGHGSSGTVFLEWSEEGELRAVKDIQKNVDNRIKTDYRLELAAMAALAKHDALFVQLFGWYESEHRIHIAMEYVPHGNLSNYLKAERTEDEAKIVIRQLLKGLVAIQLEGFAHRDLKPENIFVVSISPLWVKIGDFGLAKQVGNGAALLTMGGTWPYAAPEMWGIDPNSDSSEYTSSVDIWSLGVIAHEILMRAPPFKNTGELELYCRSPKFPKQAMLSREISLTGVEFVEGMLAYPPERRLTAMEALGSEWLRPEEAEEVERAGKEEQGGKTPSSIAKLALKAMRTRAKATEETETETADKIKPPPSGRSSSDRWGSALSTPSGEPPRLHSWAGAISAPSDANAAREHAVPRRHAPSYIDRSFNPLPAVAEARVTDSAGSGDDAIAKGA